MTEILTPPVATEPESCPAWCLRHSGDEQGLFHVGPAVTMKVPAWESVTGTTDLTVRVSRFECPADQKRRDTHVELLRDDELVLELPVAVMGCLAELLEAAARQYDSASRGCACRR